MAQDRKQEQQQPEGARENKAPAREAKQPRPAPAPHAAGKKQSRNSLVEALQALAADMSKAATEADAKAGMKRLEQIREAFRADEIVRTDSALGREAAQMVARIEQLLKQLYRRLARQRRAQEGEAMRYIAARLEAAGPTLLPTELIQMVVRSTVGKQTEKPQQTDSPAPRTADEKPPKPRKKPGQAKKTEGPQTIQAASVPTPKAEPASAVREEFPQPIREEPVQIPAAQPEPALQPAPQEQPDEAGAWNHLQRLVAHMAESLREDPHFFERLRDAAHRPDGRLAPPEDDRDAETHYKLVHDLGRRLVNLELRARSLAEPGDPQIPKAPLLQAGARELKHFFRDLKNAKQRLPQMAGEYERLFGGYAAQFRQMLPEKGAQLLEACGREAAPARQQPEPHGAEADRQAEPQQEAPQLVLRRREEWEQ